MCFQVNRKDKNCKMVVVDGIKYSSTSKTDSSVLALELIPVQTAPSDNQSINRFF